MKQEVRYLDYSVILIYAPVPFWFPREATSEQIRKADYRLVIMQAKEVWPDGTFNVVNVQTLQPWQWIDRHQVHVGGFAPLPLDTLEMGLAAGMEGKVLDIHPCPVTSGGSGRVVLTTVDRLASGVIELTLRDAKGADETLRTTSAHLFYSVTRGEWLPAGELQPSETLDGLGGPVTVAAFKPLPGAQRVYNMTVQGEHLYRVASCGVLVHNSCHWDKWGVGEHALQRKANWSKLFGKLDPTLDTIKPYLDDVLANGTWTKVGDARGPGGKVIGEILQAEYNGVWVRAIKELGGTIIVNNGGVL